jgi:hypothetical protein
MDMCEEFRLSIGYSRIFWLGGGHFHALPTFVLQLRTLVEGGTGSLALPAPQGFNHHQLLSFFTAAGFSTFSEAL